MQEVLQHRHLRTHAALSSTNIQPPLYFPVRKPVSNEAKNRDIYFRVSRSFYSYFDMKLHYVVNNAMYNWVIFYLNANKITICQISYPFLFLFVFPKLDSESYSKHGGGVHFQRNLSKKIDHPLFPLAAARRPRHNSMEYTTAVGCIVLLETVAAVQYGVDLV